jgi:flavin-dependent dehydrogenase
MSEHNYDVIIIRDGPAGLFTGIACSRNELRTLVLEKQTYLIDKFCSEGIMPSGVINLRKLVVTPFRESFFSGQSYSFPPPNTFERTSYI